MQWLMLQQDYPEDYVIATGRTETIRNFTEMVASEIGWSKGGRSIIWEGHGVDEIGRRSDNGEIIIRIDKKYFRPAEVDFLLGDSSKAKKKLGWVPKIKLEELVKEMVEYDLLEAKREASLISKDL